MPRNAKSPASLLPAGRRPNQGQNVDGDHDLTEVDYDEFDLAVMIGSQGRIPVSLSSDDRPFL